MTTETVNVGVFNPETGLIDVTTIEREVPAVAISYQRLLPVDFKLGMLRLNITPDMVNSAISEMPEPDRTIADIYWSSADRFSRDNPLIDQIAAVFGKTPEEVNEVWLQSTPEEQA